MQLYTGSEPIDWVYHGKKTVEEMTGDHRFPQPGTAAVLYDDGAGKVFDWIFLDALAARYGVEVTESQATYEAIIEAMNKPLPAVTAEELQKVSDTAAAAQNVAKKAQEQAEQAAAGSNPQVASFAAMMMPTVAPTVRDNDLAKVSTLAPDWSAGKQYKKGEALAHEGVLYRVSQDHTSQDTWKPGEAGTEALYYSIEIADDGIIVWKQPGGEYNQVNRGDLRHYPNAGSPVYESLIDANTWKPDEYPQGWRKVE